MGKMLIFIGIIFAIIWGLLHFSQKFFHHEGNKSPASVVPALPAPLAGTPEPSVVAPKMRGGSVGLRQPEKAIELFHVHRERFFGFNNSTLRTEGGEYAVGFPCKWGLVTAVNERSAVVLEPDGLKGFIASDDRAPLLDAKPEASPAPAPSKPDAPKKEVPPLTYVDNLDYMQAREEGVTPPQTLEDNNFRNIRLAKNGHGTLIAPSAPAPK
jgi:hypothetical protein